MDVIELLLGHENCRIKFSTGEGEYEGTISRIAPEIQLLVFTKLVWLPKNLKLGTLTFRANEIGAFSVIGRSETPKFDASSVNLYPRDSHRPAIFDDEFDSFSVSESDSMLESNEREYLFNLPPSLSNYFPLDNVIIDEFDENFYDAIQHFKKQDFIGVSFESPKIGRHEHIDWVCISTVSCTFLFDIKTLGESAFSNGLCDILEDSLIEKIIHDCREVSDCLFHSYDIRLSSVFDTQIADFIINAQQQEDGKIVHRVNTLNSCLAHYLNVPQDFLFHRKKKSRLDELVFYGLRPLRDDLRDYFTKNVIYLRRLKQELDLLLMEPFNKCVDVYMKSLRNKTYQEMQLESFVHNLFPNELLSEGIQVFRFREHVEIPSVVRSGPPYRGHQDSYFNYYKKHEIEPKK